MMEMTSNKFKPGRLFRWLLPFYFLIFPLSLLLILDPGLGKFLWLQHRKETIKREVAKEIQRGLEKEQIIVLKFSLEELRTKIKWRGAKEFEFNHELYDVVDSASEDDKILFWCWRDQEETKIEKEIDAAIFHSLKNQDKSLISQEGSNSTPRIYLFSPSGHLCVARPGLFSPLYISAYQATYSLNHQPPSPPPRWLT